MHAAGRKLAYFSFLACVVLLTSSCGGGGGSSGGPPPGTLALSTSAVSFKAAPFAGAPATQTIVGTAAGVTSGTLYVTVVVNNPGSFFTVSNVTIANGAGTVNVIPAVPSSLHLGHFQGSITVTACLNDPTCQTGQLAGSPQTVQVSYDVVSAVDGDTVTPRVVAANAPSSVILRGTGFTGVTSVSFGSTAATSMTVVSDSEIHASYPALPAGTYPITIDSGAVTDTASLIAVSPPAFTATMVPYPSGYVDTGGPEIEYDAQRTALFVVFPAVEPQNTAVLQRYAFDGSGWGTPTLVSMPGLVQVHLSPDGSRLLALVFTDLSHMTMVELDPVTLAQIDATTVATLATFQFFGGFALANDGNAIVGNSGAFAYGTFSRTFTPIPSATCCSTIPEASGNGAIVEMGGPTYVASTEEIQPGPKTNFVGSDLTDFTGDKVLNGNNVVEPTGQILGGVPDYYGGVLNAAGTRVYSINMDGNTGDPVLDTYDLTAIPTGSPATYPEVETPITLPGCLSAVCPQGFYSLTLSPDGATVFIAGPSAFWVQPVSP